MKLLKSRPVAKWLRSLLLVMTPLFIFCSILCVYLIRVSIQNITEMNSSFLSSIKQNNDGRLKEITNYVLSFEISSNNTTMRNLTDISGQIPSTAYQISDAFHDYLVSNNVVNGIFVYYPKSDLVSGNFGSYSSENYYNLLNYPDTEGYDKWIDSLSSYTEYQIAQIPIGDELPFCAVYPMLQRTKLSAVIVVVLSPEELLNNFQAVESWENFSIALMIDKTIVSQTGNPNLLKHMQGSQNDPPEDVLFFSDNIFTLSERSDVPRLNYVIGYSAERLLAGIRIPLMVSLGGIIICIVMSIYAAVSIAIRNSRPMIQLVSALGGKTAEAFDEYQFIMEKFNQAEKKQFQNQEDLIRHQNLLNRLFLNFLLSEGSRSESNVFKMAQNFDVNFEAPYYLVTLFQNNDEHALERFDKSDFVQNISNSTEISFIVATYENFIVLLIMTDRPLLQNELLPLIKNFRTILFEDSAFPVSIGKTIDNMSGIIASYHYARIALKEVRAQTDEKIIFYTDSMQTNLRESSEAMKIFSSLIYSNEFLQAFQLADQLFEEYIYPVKPSTQLIRLNAVISLIGDALYQSSPKTAERKILGLLENIKNPEIILQKLKQELDLLNSKTIPLSTKKTSVAEQAKNFIDHNFTNPMMGLYMVAEELGVNNSYLSTIFKRTYGINTIQYINQLRIAMAKNLILSTDKTIKEIASEAGFSSEINFIRVFKKMESTTPSTLRKKE